MRKVVISIAIFILLLGGYYLMNYTGFYFDFHPNREITADIKTEGKNIYIKDKDNDGYKEFEIKGVEVSSSLPGKNGTDFAVNRLTWLRWFKQIQEMGANTIKIATIFDDTFYNAFYEFNSSSEEHIYLLQGIQVSDYANNSQKDAYDDGFFKSLQEDSLIVIDIIHGKRSIASANIKGSGQYRKDISPWVLGYIVGNGWNPGTMAYTNKNKDYNKIYEGKYFKTFGDSTVFEAMLAKIIDGMVSYESKKYKSQRLVTFFNDPQNDPFEYDIHYAMQLNKYNMLNAENIKPTDEFKGAYVAAYMVYEFIPDFSKYFSVEQKSDIVEELGILNKDLFYYGYTELLAKYHTIPVIVSGYGFSTSRGTDSEEGAINEYQQGLALITAYEDIMKSGCSGAIINSWQDTWGRASWNTSYSVDAKDSNFWNDVQTYAQGYGLMSFDAGENAPISYIDGDSSEWDEKDIVLSDNGTNLSVMYDESHMYLLVEKEGLTEDMKFYIPIDTTPKSGTNTTISGRITFERMVDFIISFSGQNNSKILVQERYESIKSNYSAMLGTFDPYPYPPKIDSQKFIPISMILKNNKMISEEMDAVESRALRLFDSYETGKMIYGNSNPNSRDYNSLADFHYGNNLVEIRIPWQILNFSNPANMKIHDDYYVNYGVEEISISKLYIGFSEINQESPAKMVPVKLKGWSDKVTYHERLKDSYFMLKKIWGE